MSGKKSLITYFISCFLCVVISYSHNSSIRFSLSTDKSYYYETENIKLFVTMMNAGKSIDSINESEFILLEKKIWVENENGVYASRIELPDPDYVNFIFRKFKPGEAYVIPIPLDYVLGYGNFKQYKIGDKYFFPEGEYTVGYYKVKVNFKVIHPTGADEEALGKMIKAYGISIYGDNGYYSDSISKKAEIFFDVYKNYPGGIYEQQAFLEYFDNFVKIHDIDSSAFQVFNDFINRFPDNEKAEQVLFYMSRSLYRRSNNDAVVEYLNGLKKRYPLKNAGIVANALIISEKYKK